MYISNEVIDIFWSDLFLPFFIFPFIFLYFSNNHFKGYVLKNGKMGRLVISFSLGLLTAIVSLFIQGTIREHSGALKEIRTVDELSYKNGDRKYHIKDYFIDIKHVTYTAYLTYKKNNNTVLNVIFTSPIKSYSSSVNTKILYGFLATPYSIVIKDKGTQGNYKALKEYYEQVKINYMDLDFTKIQYFKKVPNSEKLVTYNKCAAKNKYYYNKEVSVILEASLEPYGAIDINSFFYILIAEIFYFLVLGLIYSGINRKVKKRDIANQPTNIHLDVH
ncbi:hypothetical protein [Flammeovirga kamogawensis]|uniref:DUF3592 domain-containing protein n=1 Tax=Flammeovirga kamogawensis TaxID=373891 RepID=A0ABX8H1T8_9BACT|nr:hypothetical protein [Flammeovirga kamogawensis]MBB6463569.1 hypothetical protein [Flammeovirga kamogawensis]QWG09795.1 hypothetical protein KM029_19130 [Flammeovirga kamogawensis]TRX65303.1 hypothetical protein EO216_22535 [Flammeovirga kamogawensis]